MSGALRRLLTRSPRRGRLAVRSTLLMPEPATALSSALSTVAATVLAIGLVTLPAAAQYGPVDPFEASVRTLREGLGAPNDGLQHASMVALRGLRSASTKPLFESLLSSDDWSLRVDAVLGLAELRDESDASRVDLDLIESLPSEADRETAIGAAIALGLLDEAQIAEVLGWEDLRAPLRALLALELRRLGGTPADEVLARLADSRTPEIAGIGAALLLDLGHPRAEEARGKALEAIAALGSERARSSVVAQCVDACTVNNLTGAAPFAATLAGLEGLADDARLRALGSLLVLSPDDAAPLLAATAEGKRTQLGLMRLASVMLASGATLPPERWEALRNGDRLLETIADAGLALGDGDLERGYRLLTELRHRVTLRAVVDGAVRRGASDERALGLACLALLEQDRRELGPLLESTLVALSRLASVEPEALGPALERAASDSDLQEALLLALSSAGTADAAAVAGTARGRASRRGSALVAVLDAKYRDSIDDQTLGTLGVVAGGGANVDPTTQTQAAWLWLQHAGRAQEAVAELVGESDAGTREEQAS